MSNKQNKKNQIRVELEVKDINDDFSKEIEQRKKIIILAEHSKSYAKEYAFKAYANKRFKYRGDKYVIAIAHLDFIPLENLKPNVLFEILKNDLNKVYDEFVSRYPNALLEKPFSFNYALDYSEKTNKAEIMTIAVMRTSEGFARVQFSPIAPITKEQYDMILGKVDTEEGRLLHDIMTEKRSGIEQYGIVGYLTDGKIKTHNMYMEVLMDLIPDYKNVDGFRTKLLEYKNYRVHKSAYLFSIKTEEEKKAHMEEEKESIV